ncbi:entry exclusion lipoprotein TrbK [Providencia rettgeri]|uniref:entry exclusion lipoprotein TrbK n=1 Tax=Alcaligenes faecalis TaxID=511 RepID=UPI001D6DBC28|nr:entry exclusion lipoprotein TrbK [Providencia rettgeri]
MKNLIIISFLIGLVGCDSSMPEPNAATCAPGAYQKALDEIRSESKRKAFAEECKGFQRAQDMRKWEFKPSSPDRY